MLDWSEILDQALEENSGGKPAIKSPAYENFGLPPLKSWEAGRVYTEWEIDSRMLNSRGDLMGGVYGVLGDAVLGLTAMTVLEGNEFFKTADLRISFFRPISKGIIRIEGIVVNRSRSLIHLEATFKNEEDKLLAKALAVQAVTPFPEKSE